MINGLETAREFHDKLIEFDESRLDSQSNREWQNINSDINPFYYNGKKYDELIFCHIPKTGGTSINAAFGWTYFCDPPPHIANETEGTLRPHLNIGTEHRITDKHLYPDCCGHMLETLKHIAFVEGVQNRFSQPNYEHLGLALHDDRAFELHLLQKSFPGYIKAHE